MKSPLGTHQGPAVRVLAVYHDEERANQGEEEARRELRDFPGILRWIWLRFAMHTVLWSRLEFSHVLHVAVSMHTVCHCSPLFATVWISRPWCHQQSSPPNATISRPSFRAQISHLTNSTVDQAGVLALLAGALLLAFAHGQAAWKNGKLQTFVGNDFATIGQKKVLRLTCRSCRNSYNFFLCLVYDVHGADFSEHQTPEWMHLGLRDCSPSTSARPMRKQLWAEQAEQSMSEIPKMLWRSGAVVSSQRSTLGGKFCGEKWRNWMEHIDT